ncbi:acyl-CoA thioesterase [Candidatus Arthromitus sp. SFB-rat-Yit]|uniref:acyl-CoA thioesterase n=1 Tax=Candidatus Arthromitus sp. SFB-rat-Yit TaxID=1041504 RepID=UPI0003116CC1|nr:acyl-CoA thioesterase [Candidatus Arthromitus sp. SFB-rat-Yit]
MKSIKDIEVRYSETDQMGVVYHSNYLIWMEIGRTNFIKDSGFNMMDFERKGFLFPVYEMDIKFMSPARYDENIHVETSIHKLSKVKMIYEQRIFNDKNEEKTRAFVTIVCVTKKDFKIVRFDKEMKEFYNKCLSSLEK